jgi:hypothetical protein
LSSVTIPEGVTSLGAYAFSACTNLTSVVIPDSVTSIGANAFTACTSLTAITVSTNNPVYSSVAGVLFNKNQTTIIQYPGGTAGTYTIPNSVTSIGGWAFATCASLTSVTIPDSVASLGEWAFSACTNLTGVYFHGNAPSVGSSVFHGDTNATAYYLPGTTGWENFAAVTGIKAVLWNPQAQNDRSFGVRTNRFGFNITGTSGLVVVVEACTNFTNPVWQPVQTNTLTGGASNFSDPQWTNYPARFYRFRLP